LKLAGSADGKRLAVLGRGPAGMPDRLSVWSAEKSLVQIGRPGRLAPASDVVAIQADMGLIAVGSGPELSLWNLADLKKSVRVTLARSGLRRRVFPARQTSDGFLRRDADAL